MAPADFQYSPELNMQIAGADCQSQSHILVGYVYEQLFAVLGLGVTVTYVHMTVLKAAFGVIASPFVAMGRVCHQWVYPI